MFGEIGLSELLIVAAVILVLTRPQDVPVIMRRAGLTYAYVHMYLQGVWMGWQEKLGLLTARSSQRDETL